MEVFRCEEAAAMCGEGRMEEPDRKEGGDVFREKGGRRCAPSYRLQLQGWAPALIDNGASEGDKKEAQGKRRQMEKTICGRSSTQTRSILSRLRDKGEGEKKECEGGGSAAKKRWSPRRVGTAKIDRTGTWIEKERKLMKKKSGQLI